MYKFIFTSLLCLSLWQPAAKADILYGAVQYKNVTGKIGVNINRKGMIRGVHPDSPAAQAGLAAGDVVEVVNGKPGDVWHIHGLPDTYVNLMVRRGSSHFKVQVKRIDYHEIRHELNRENNHENEHQTASKDEVA
jgi:C-terminal processing protease CtpA/Prc